MIDHVHETIPLLKKVLPEFDIKLARMNSNTVKNTFHRNKMKALKFPKTDKLMMLQGVTCFIICLLFNIWRALKPFLAFSSVRGNY